MKKHFILILGLSMFLRNRKIKLQRTLSHKKQKTMPNTDLDSILLQIKIG